jgi:Protein of unknown function (DUF1761)
LAVWFGFVLTTQAVNHGFGRRPLMLLAIDAGHWLVVLLVQGNRHRRYGGDLRLIPLQSFAIAVGPLVT